MSHMPKDVSVVICAHMEERWNDLLAAVESLRRQSLTPLEIVVVVDHNPRLYERVVMQLPGVVAVENAEQRGLSGARNAGIGATHGAFVAFLDDDAVAAPDWLERLRAGCERGDVLGVGGASIPMWPGRQPDWFPDEYLWTVGCSYRGLPKAIAPVRNLFGGCSCMRRTVFEAAGGFRHEVGRVGRRLISCDETEFCVRVRQCCPAGVFLYDPSALIYHRVPPNRATWSYFLSRCYNEGLSKALVTRFVGSRAGLQAERQYTLRTLPQGVVRAIADVLLRQDPGGAMRAGAIVAGLVFTMAGYGAGKFGQIGAGPQERLQGHKRETLLLDESIQATAGGHMGVAAKKQEG